MSRAPDPPLDALDLAVASATVERRFRLADFARLADRLATPEGVARAQLAFASAGGVPTGELRVQAEAVLVCQRCLGPLRRTLESSSQLAFVPREDTAVPADYEAIAGDPERIDLAALVEDELLLSLPLIVTHGPGEECRLPASSVISDADAGPRAQDRLRPFAGLRDLLKH